MLDMQAYKEMTPEDKIATLAAWLDMAAHTIERQAALITDLETGAEQRSQSHADVLAKIAAFRNGNTRTPAE